MNNIYNYYHFPMYISHTPPPGKLHRTAQPQLPEAQQNRHQCVLPRIPSPVRSAQHRRALDAVVVSAHLLSGLRTRPASTAAPRSAAPLVAAAALLVRPIADGQHPAQMQRAAAGHAEPCGRIFHRHAGAHEAHRLRAPELRHRRGGGHRSGIGWQCRRRWQQQPLCYRKEQRRQCDVDVDVIIIGVAARGARPVWQQ